MVSLKSEILARYINVIKCTFYVYDIWNVQCFPIVNLRYLITKSIIWHTLVLLHIPQYSP